MDTVFNYNIGEEFGFSVVELKGERKYYVEGYASTIDEDKAGEVIDYDAQVDMVNQLTNQNITMDIEHEEWYDENNQLLPRPKNEKIPVAKIVSAELKPRGTWIKAELNTHLRSFQELWGSIKSGFLKAFSVAFYPTSKSGNKINKLNLVNITLTGSPVNPNATFTASMKNASAYLDLKSKEENKMADAIVKAADTNEVNKPSVEPKAEKDKLPEDEEAEKKKKKDDDDKKDEEKMSKVKAEIMAEIEAKVKALKEDAEAKDKLIAELKAKIEEPVMKAIVTEAPKIIEVVKNVNPLSQI